MSKFSVRPVHNKSGKATDLKDIYKIFVPSKLYISLRPTPKDLWALEDEEGSVMALGKLAQAQEEVQNKVLQITNEFKDLFGLTYADSYTLKRFETTIQQATEVILSEVIQDGQLPLAKSDLWIGILTRDLTDKLVSPGLLIENVEAFGEGRSFKVMTVSTLQSSKIQKPLGVHNVSKACSIVIKLPSAVAMTNRGFRLRRDGLYGLESQFNDLDKILLSYDPVWSFRSPRGVLLMGPAGTGKTAVLNRISELPWTKQLIVMQRDIVKDPSTALLKLAHECVASQPSLIVFQHLQRLFKGSEGDTALEDALLDMLDITRGKRVLVIAETETATRLPTKLLHNFFTEKIQFESPSEAIRKDILNSELLSQNASLNPSEALAIISQKTPGYTGNDLCLVAEKAIFTAQLRSAEISAKRPTTPATETPAPVVITLADLEAARETVAPSALTEGQRVSYKAVRWSDIGGQEETKKTVEKLFDWPLKYPEKFKRLGLKPGKGLLLYGPPGCSKTMTALALATEAKLNFIAIKGAELLSKYVGESEQNLRNVFARARAAAPCVVFFDEVDSIGSSGSSEKSHGGANLVTTLLNELDGVDELKGVSVLAATNKPWELDQALLRPGRFDGIIYVRLPDEATRRDIIRIKLNGMAHYEQSASSDGLDIHGIDLDFLARETDGCSGAEVVDLCNNAGMIALEEHLHATTEATRVDMRHFDAALAVLRRETSPALIERYDAFAGRARRL